MTTDAPGVTPAPKSLPPHPDLDHLRKQAKQRLKHLRQFDPAAQLAEAQLAVAREYGSSSWRALKRRIEGTPTRAELPQPWSIALAVEIAEARRRDDVDAEERVILELQAQHPDDEALQAYHADFLLDRRGDAQGAKTIFERLLARPTTETLRHYADFLQRSSPADLDAVDAVYRQAIALDTDPVQLGAVLNNYGWFLLHRRNDEAAAEWALHQAAELECGYPLANAVHLAAYATFLWQHGDARKAEAYFRRSRALSRKDVASALPFAALLTATGRTKEGFALAREVLESWFPAVVSDRAGLELECWFLVYAHGSAGERREALPELKTRLLAPGAKLHACNDLSRNAAAVASSHPEPALVQALAAILSWEARPVDGELAALDRNRAWVEIPLPASSPTATPPAS